MSRKAFVDKDTCIGCTVCNSLCPEVFTVKEDPGYNNDFKSTPDDSVDQLPIENKVQEAIDMCPVQCIHWREEKENAQSKEEDK